jgi:hypothetical protein
VLQRLYELAVSNRNLQREKIRLIEGALSQAQRNDTAGYNKSITEYNQRVAKYNANVTEINRILRTLR